MKIESPFELVHKLVGVRAVVAGPRRRAPCRLIVDTGAVYTTLVPAYAEGALGFSHEHMHQATVVRSATSEERGYLVTFPQLTVLGLVFRSVETNIADLGHGIDGLLGMNVLSQLNFEVRPGERRIVAERIGA